MSNLNLKLTAFLFNTLKGSATINVLVTFDDP